MPFLRVKRDDFRVRYLTNLLPDLHQIWTAYRGWQFVAGVGLVRLTRGEKRGVKVGLVESNRGWDKKSCTFNLWCENGASNRSGASGDFQRTSVLIWMIWRGSWTLLNNHVLWVWAQSSKAITNMKASKSPRIQVEIFRGQQLWTWNCLLAIIMASYCGPDRLDQSVLERCVWM